MNEKEENKTVSEETAASPAYEIVGVRFKTTGKIYYFDPQGLKLDAAQIAALEKEFMDTFETFTVILSLSKK